MHLKRFSNIFSIRSARNILFLGLLLGILLPLWSESGVALKEIRGRTGAQ